MRPLRVLVVDDEPLARRRVVALLGGRPEVASIDEARDGDEALAALGRDDVDLAFLDVQMPGRGGLEVAVELGPETLPAVVFVTAFDRYAVEAFEVNAVDYLLKPFDDARFDQAFRRALGRIEGAALDELRRALGRTLEALSPAGEPGFGPGPGPGAEGSFAGPPGQVAVEKGGRIRLVPVRGIDWVEAAGNYVRLHVAGEAFLVRAPLKEVERHLGSRRFLRIHRSVIVNLERVREIERRFGGEHVVVLRDGTALPISRRYRRQLPRLGGGGG